MRYVVLGMLLLAMGSSWAENWQSQGPVVNDRQFFVDMDRIQPVKVGVVFWQKEVHPQAKEVLLFEMLGNCQTYEVVVRHAYLYTSAGELVRDFPGPYNFNTPPGSNLEKSLKSACTLVPREMI